MPRAVDLSMAHHLTPSGLESDAGYIARERRAGTTHRPCQRYAPAGSGAKPGLVLEEGPDGGYETPRGRSSARRRARLGCLVHSLPPAPATGRSFDLRYYRKNVKDKSSACAGLPRQTLVPSSLFGGQGRGPGGATRRGRVAFFRPPTQEPRARSLGHGVAHGSIAGRGRYLTRFCSTWNASDERPPRVV